MSNALPLPVRTPLVWLAVPFGFGLWLGRGNAIAAEIAPLLIGIFLPVAVYLGFRRRVRRGAIKTEHRARSTDEFAFGRGLPAYHGHLDRPPMREFNGGVASGIARMWLFAFVVAALALGALWADQRFHPAPEPYRTGKLPPREAILTLNVERLFDTAFNQQTGVARIVDADHHLADLIGCRVFFAFEPHADAPLVRSTVFSAQGVLTPIVVEAGTDGFDEYLLDFDVSFTYRRGYIQRILDPGRTFHRASSTVRRYFIDQLEKGSHGSETTRNYAAILRAMFLGDKSGVPDDWESNFIATGTLHLFAISGLHVAIIAVVLKLMFRILRVRDPWATIAVLAILLGYVEVTGAKPSATRAFTMVAFFMSAGWFTRRPHPFSALVGSGLALLVWQPVQLWNAGFQLSYTVVGVILLVGAPAAGSVREALPRPDFSLDPLRPKWWLALCECIAQPFAIGFAATVASAPLIAHHFGVITPGSILLSIPLAYLALLALVSAILSVATSVLGVSVVTVFFNHAGWVVASIMIILIDSAAAIPGWFLEHNLENGLIAAGSSFAAVVALYLLGGSQHQQSSALKIGALLSLTVGAFVFDSLL